MARYAYVNGKIVPEKKAVISIFDRGFVLGDGLFETLRAVDYVPEFLPQHYQRMKKSAHRLKLRLPMTLQEMGTTIFRLCQKSRLRDAGVRITLSRGLYDGGLSISPLADPTLVIALLPVPGLKSEIYTRGVSVVVSQINKEAASGFDASVKTTNYLANILAKSEADKAGSYEAILLGRKGEIAELTTSSFFCVKRGMLLTPKLDSGILPGITRNEVIKLAKKRGIPVKEVDISLKTVPQMKEAFLTSSIRGLVPIRKIGEITLGEPEKWTIAPFLRECYQKHCQNSRGRFFRT